jgi:hypothetical protein
LAENAIFKPFYFITAAQKDNWSLPKRVYTGSRMAWYTAGFQGLF